MPGENPSLSASPFVAFPVEAITQRDEHKGDILTAEQEQAFPRKVRTPLARIAASSRRRSSGVRSAGSVQAGTRSSRRQQ